MGEASDFFVPEDVVFGIADSLDIKQAGIIFDGIGENAGGGMIEPGEVGGKVRYQGALWSAQADERIPPGESVRIKGCDNLTLIVEKKSKEE